MTASVPLPLLGRLSLEESSSGIDLSPFGAVSQGVSRVHALIRYFEGACTVTDLGSRNGTWLNENPLEPNNAHALNNGDVLRLGSMMLYLFLH